MSKPKIAQKKPYVLTGEKGVIFWCSCGESTNQPFCDGSHRGSKFKPVKVEIAESKQIAWCGCKQSSNIPFCDGTHSKL